MNLLGKLLVQDTVVEVVVKLTDVQLEVVGIFWTSANKILTAISSLECSFALTATIVIKDKAPVEDGVKVVIQPALNYTIFYGRGMYFSGLLAAIAEDIENKRGLGLIRAFD